MSIVADADLVAIAVVTACHLVGGIAAFGSALLSVPLLLLWWGPSALDQVVYWVLTLGLAQAGLLVWRNWRELDLRRCGPVIGAAVLTLPGGMLLVGQLPRTPVVLGLAGVVAAAALHAWRSAARDATDHQPHPRWASLGIGATGGLIHGAFGIGGSVLVIGMRGAHAERDRFRAGLALLWTVLGVGYLTIAELQGQQARPALANLIIGIAGVLVATWLGDRLAHRLRGPTFTRLVAGLLVISAAGLTWSALR